MAFTLKQPLASEKEIEMMILRYLHVRGIFVWKEPTIGMYDEQKKAYRRPNNPFLIKGKADILGVMPDGRLLAIEIKTPARKKNVSRHQQLFLDLINKNNAIAFVATCIEDVERELSRRSNGETDHQRQIQGWQL